MAPMTTRAQYAETFIRDNPFARTAVRRVPNTVPRIVPCPPFSDVPPRIAAVMAFMSQPSPGWLSCIHPARVHDARQRREHTGQRIDEQFHAQHWNSHKNSRVPVAPDCVKIAPKPCASKHPYKDGGGNQEKQHGSWNAQERALSVYRKTRSQWADRISFGNDKRQAGEDFPGCQGDNKRRQFEN